MAITAVGSMHQVVKSICPCALNLMNRPSFTRHFLNGCFLLLAVLSERPLWVDSGHPVSTIRKAVGCGHLAISQPLDEQ